MASAHPPPPHPDLPLDAGQMLGWLPRLRRYARALRRNREDADDLVQDTLERAWSRAGLWHGVGDMRTWLFSIMHNLHVDALRRGRLELVDLDEHSPEVAVAAAQAERLALRDLEAALSALPPEQREVLLLVALDGLGYAEIAQALGIPIGTVMSRLSRGRGRLRGLMDGDAVPAGYASLSRGTRNSALRSPSTQGGPSRPGSEPLSGVQHAISRPDSRGPGLAWPAAVQPGP